MSKTIKIEVLLKSLVDEIEIDDDLMRRLEERKESPEDYAIRVAEERFADLLRDGDVFDALYGKASFRVQKSE